MLSSRKLRLLIAAPDPLYTEELCACITGLYPDVEAFSANICMPQLMSEEINLCIGKQVIESRCHILILDQALLADEYHFKDLCKIVSPARCVLLTGNNLRTLLAMRAALANIIPVPRQQWLKYFHLIRDSIAPPRLVSNLNVDQSDTFEDDLKTAGFHSAEIHELAAEIFPGASKLYFIRRMEPPIALFPVYHSPHLLLRAKVNTQGPIILLKFANRQDAENEIRNCNEHFELVHAYNTLAHPSYIATLWHAAGIIYSLPGISPEEAQDLQPVSDFYLTPTPDTDPIIEALRDFFLKRWKLYYDKRQAEQHTIYLFEQYDQSWAEGLSKALEKIDVSSIKSEDFGNKFVDPVVWVRKNKIKSEIHNLARVLNHGSLTIDDLLIDKQGKCWVINFEHLGVGPLLRDFASLEVDILTRLAPPDLGDLRAYYQFVLKLSEHFAATGIIPTSEQESVQTLEIILCIRSIAQEIHGKLKDNPREYFWGLLFTTLFYAAFLPQTTFQYKRCILLASALCLHLENWKPPSKHLSSPAHPDDKTSQLLADLLKNIERELCDCAEFGSIAYLKSCVMVNPQLSIFAKQLRPGTTQEMVLYVVAEFQHRQLQSGDNALVLFMETLATRRDENDQQRKILLDYAQSLKKLLLP